MTLQKTKALCAVLVVAQIVCVATAGATTSPTATALPGPGPVVFQFAIERTSEPLSLFNVIPPPLPLNEVLRMKGTPPPAGAEAAKGAVVPSTAPVVTASSMSGLPKDAAPTLSAFSAASTRTRPSLATLPGGKVNTVKAAPIPDLPPRPVVPPKPPPPPAPTPNPYPDLVVLVGDKPLACRIVGDVGGSLRVELPNGAVVHLPKQRIMNARKAAAP
ncbi:MAG: hypothetical protein N3D11_10915 [Candidatus Sumerlaeia bacterium]|nr:hypothetical protein [Candidatus Sumerlaeia bacterium]